MEHCKICSILLKKHKKISNIKKIVNNIFTIAGDAMVAKYSAALRGQKSSGVGGQQYAGGSIGVNADRTLLGFLGVEGGVQAGAKVDHHYKDDTLYEIKADQLKGEIYQHLHNDYNAGKIHNLSDVIKDTKSVTFNTMFDTNSNKNVVPNGKSSSSEHHQQPQTHQEQHGKYYNPGSIISPESGSSTPHIKARPALSKGGKNDDIYSLF